MRATSMSHSHIPTLPADAQAISPPPIVVRERSRWEYKRLKRDLTHSAAPDEDELNKWGEEGWELSAVVQDSPLIYLYFKREK